MHKKIDEKIKELREGFNRRYRNLVERSKKFGIEPPDKEELWHKVLESYENGFICEYCGEKMMIKDPNPPYKHSWSIDHKKSLWSGGSNSIENFAIICTKCNIIKGTMSSETFTELVDILKAHDPQLLDRMFEEIYAGRFADKIDRENGIGHKNRNIPGVSKNA